MLSFVFRIGAGVIVLLATVQTVSASSPYLASTTSYQYNFSLSNTTNCPLYDYSHPPAGYRYQCTKDKNYCNRCILKSAIDTTNSGTCSPSLCEGDITVRTCSNGTILYPACTRQTDGQCLRVTPKCPDDRMTPKNNSDAAARQRAFPQPLSNCSTTPPVSLPGCQYVCSDNDIGRCPSCRYACSSYTQFPVSPLTQPDTTIYFPYNTNRIRSMKQ